MYKKPDIALDPNQEGNHIKNKSIKNINPKKSIMYIYKYKPISPKNSFPKMPQLQDKHSIIYVYI